MNNRTDIEAYRALCGSLRHVVPRPVMTPLIGVIGSDKALYLLRETGVSKVVPCEEEPS